ncbi:uncharacterized protein LOC117333109 [Pecten maximus]|uniref:uncharacterized protein LOC117333109 n=1 Tax=Pecten maximus TaxID=6579 RepID=UPI001458D5FA|nr:uncharacterized protein LOC117333109 [Pecten maximus]
MDHFAEYSNRHILGKIADGKDGKINGDNLDIYVRTNDMRMDRKNRDYHYFASDLIFDRVCVQNLDNTKPVGNVEDIPYEHFVPSTVEDKSYKDSLKILLGRILSEHLDGFKWMKPVIPHHIPHELQDVMCKKSEVFWLPIMLKNEARYSDCVQIMNEYEKLVCSWYSRVGRGGELDHLQVPVGGDQLTRVRLQGAKNLVAGALTPKDRLEHLYPVIMEMFHTLQDLLEKLYKRFYSNTSGRERGTLCHMKILIERSNVNGKVKTRFEAHEDFVLTVGCAYFLSFILKHFHMDSIEDKPQHPLLTKNVKMMHTKDKERLFSTIMSEIVDSLGQSFPLKDPNIMLNVNVLGTEYPIESVPDGNMLCFALNVNNKRFIFNVTPEEAEKGSTINIPTVHGQIPVKVTTRKMQSDDLHSYVMQFLQWYFLILSFKDTIKEGDIYRNNINLKFCIPVFFSHSTLSKYLEECIDYILKTEIMLSEKMALKVRAASFVNLTGKIGQNKAADLQKENEVMVLKDLIKGLGANKTEKAIITISKAAPVIQNVVENVESMLGICDKKTKHKKRSFEGDVKVLLKEIIPLKVWDQESGRQLKSFREIRDSPFDVKRSLFKSAVTRITQRLKLGISIPMAEDDDSEDDSELE